MGTIRKSYESSKGYSRTFYVLLRHAQIFTVMIQDTLGNKKQAFESGDVLTKTLPEFAVSLTSNLTIRERRTVFRVCRSE